LIDIAVTKDDDGDGVDNAILIARFITVDCTHRCRNHLNMCNPCAQLSEQSAKQKKANSIRLRKTHQNNKRSNKRKELLTARIKCTILKLSQSDEMQRFHVKINKFKYCKNGNILAWMKSVTITCEPSKHKYSRFSYFEIL